MTLQSLVVSSTSAVLANMITSTCHGSGSMRMVSYHGTAVWPWVLRALCAAIVGWCIQDCFLQIQQRRCLLYVCVGSLLATLRTITPYAAANTACARVLHMSLQLSGVQLAQLTLLLGQAIEMQAHSITNAQ